MKKSCKSLREHAMEVTNFKNKKNQVINKRTVEVISECKYCYIYKEKIQ